MFSSPEELKALVVRVVDGRRDVSVSGLELQGQVEGIDAILQKIQSSDVKADTLQQEM